MKKILELALAVYKLQNRNPSYLLLTRKFERELYLDGSFAKNINIDETIHLLEQDIDVLVVDKVKVKEIQGKKEVEIWKDNYFQFV